MLTRVKLFIYQMQQHPHFFLVASLAVTALGGALRFIKLSDPHALIFDETYYVRDAFTLGNAGTEQKWPADGKEVFERGNVYGFQDVGQYVVHPPIGKWVIWLGMALFGAENSFGWRFSTALIGTALVPLLIYAARLLLRSEFWSVAAGLLLAIEGQAIVLSRVAILDGILAFFVLLAFVFLLKDRAYWHERYRIAAIRGDVAPTGWRPWLLLAGTSLGLAGGVKWSAIYYLVFFGLYLVVQDWWRRHHLLGKFDIGALTQPLYSFFSLVPITILTYLAGWWGWATTETGWGRNNVKPWLVELWDYHANAFNFHVGLESDHSYQANALQWLFTVRPTAMFYESVDSAECILNLPCAQAVTALPHPLIWIIGLWALIWTLSWTIRGDKTAALIAMGFLAGWAPWLLYLERTTFQFYSVIYTPFLVLAIAYGSQRFWRNGLVFNRQERRENVLTGTLLFALLLAFFFSPIWLGVVIPYFVWRSNMWLPQWI